MPSLVTVLITQAPWLRREVERTNDLVHGLSLEVFTNLEAASERLRSDDVALVLMHLATPEHGSEVEELLQQTRDRAISTVVLADQYDDRQAIALLRAGVSEYQGLPLGAGELLYLLDSLTVRAR